MKPASVAHPDPTRTDPPVAPGKMKMESCRQTVGLVLGVSLLVVLLGCADPTSRSEEDSDEVKPLAFPDLAKFDIEESLAALGYLDASLVRADMTLSGPEVLDSRSSYRGYDLILHGGVCLVELLDPNGNLLKQWSEQPCPLRWEAVIVVDAGIAMTSRLPKHQPLRLYGWDGDLLWEADPGDNPFFRNLHHSLNARPDGTILALGAGALHLPGHGDEENRVVQQSMSLFSSEGDLIDSFGLTEAITSSALDFPLQPSPISRKPADITHCNSIVAMREIPGRASPIYSERNILVSCRHQNALFVFDTVERELIWFWGPGELDGQHDATLLDDGNILTFDNGLLRGWSRIVELDPESKTIVWSYGNSTGPNFFTKTRGTAQRLPNGNTLFAVSNDGEAFEVTHDGRLVFRYGSPHLTKDQHRKTIHLYQRIEPSLMDPLVREWRRSAN